jgi:YidC/Oxa1 family membrane protein insertase
MWNTIILDPMVNTLIWFYGILGDNYLLSIIVLTIITRLIVFPLTWQQQKSAVAMQEIQPKLKEIQDKYKGDPETLQRKTMEMYREHGVNPLGGCLPTLIQFPILIGFYQAITRSLAASPIQLLELSQHIYNPLPQALAWLPNANALIPLDSMVGSLNLASKPTSVIGYALPVLVVISTWLQQKLLTPPGGGEGQAAAMSRSMQLTMPLFIGYISLTFPTGLSIYWVTSNVIGIAQYMMMGRASLQNLFGTEDGSFSLTGLLGISPPKEEPKGRSSRSKKKK